MVWGDVQGLQHGKYFIKIRAKYILTIQCLSPLLYIEIEVGKCTKDVGCVFRVRDQQHFTRLGAMAWRWRDQRMRKQFELTLDTKLDNDGFKKALDDSVERKIPT